MYLYINLHIFKVTNIIIGVRCFIKSVFDENMFKEMKDNKLILHRRM